MGLVRQQCWKNIAISWAEDNLLAEFNFVFLVSMDQVKQESKLGRMYHRPAYRTEV